MIQDISNNINWIKKNPIILKNIFRGIERETLRIQKNGIFSTVDHPATLGSALTHKWITTDFSENLLELITPKNKNIDNLLYFLQDLHIFVSQKNQNEFMWPFSMPFFSKKNVNIKIAQYGQSNIGKMKNLYRLGLKNRYGDMSNTISGVHYNFSLPREFWYEWNKNNKKKEKDYVSSGYLHLIRNYYRFGWIIPYLFGSSPAISSYLIQNKKNTFNKNIENNFYLPWSTSLRLSDLGYTSTSIVELNINFNNLQSYTQSLTNAINTPSKKFIKIGLKNKKGDFKQLNTNILQMENELYTQIRPKRNTFSGESLIHALNSRGIEYVEIRSLDVNPFSPIGINKNQILLLDLFLIWCTLQKSPKMYQKDFILAKKNWKKVIFEGRKPNQKIYINTKKEKKTLIEISKKIFAELEKIAIILDCLSEKKIYQQVCKKKQLFFYYPELTYSAQCLKLFIKNGIKTTGLKLAHQHHQYLMQEPFHILNKKNLEKEAIYSHDKQKKIEIEDKISFEEYLKHQ